MAIYVNRYSYFSSAKQNTTESILLLLLEASFLPSQVSVFLLQFTTWVLLLTTEEQERWLTLAGRIMQYPDCVCSFRSNSPLPGAFQNNNTRAPNVSCGGLIWLRCPVSLFLSLPQLSKETTAPPQPRQEVMAHPPSRSLPPLRAPSVTLLRRTIWTTRTRARAGPTTTVWVMPQRRRRGTAGWRQHQRKTAVTHLAPDFLANVSNKLHQKQLCLWMWKIFFCMPLTFFQWRCNEMQNVYQ